MTLWNRSKTGLIAIDASVVARMRSVVDKSSHRCRLASRTIWPRLHLLGVLGLVRSRHHYQSQTADIHQCCNGDRSGCSASQCCSSGRARGWTFEGTAGGQSRCVLKRSFVLPQFSHADRRHAKKPTEFSRHMLQMKRVCTFSRFESSCINKQKT